MHAASVKLISDLHCRVRLICGGVFALVIDQMQLSDIEQATVSGKISALTPPSNTVYWAAASEDKLSNLDFADLDENLDFCENVSCGSRVLSFGFAKFAVS